jgi:2'-hydroxyisoflavone reductase
MTVLSLCIPGLFVLKPAASISDPETAVILSIDNNRLGTYNMGRRTITFREFLDACGTATRSDADFIWIPRDYLASCGLQPGIDFPYWSDEAIKGALEISCQKAFDTGWTTRPFEETANDTLLWFYESRAAAVSDEYVRKEHLSPNREAEVIRLWSERHS